MIACQCPIMPGVHSAQCPFCSVSIMLSVHQFISVPTNLKIWIWLSLCSVWFQQFLDLKCCLHYHKRCDNSWSQISCQTYQISPPKYTHGELILVKLGNNWYSAQNWLSSDQVCEQIHTAVLILDVKRVHLPIYCYKTYFSKSKSLTWT